MRRPPPLAALVVVLAQACSGGGPSAPIGTVADRVVISDTQVTFSPEQQTLILEIENRGRDAVSWTVDRSAIPAWLQVSPTAGTVRTGRTEIVLRVDRTGLGPGLHQVTLNVGVGAMTFAVVVTVVVDPPLGVALEGHVVDQFTGAGVDGVAITFEGTPASSGIDGSFSVPGGTSADLRTLIFRGPMIYTRITFARSGDSLWRVVSRDFNMVAYRLMVRGRWDVTTRWVTDPHVYINTGTASESWVEEARGAVADIISEWSNGEITAASVTVGSDPPENSAPGTIVIHFGNDLDNWANGSATNEVGEDWSIVSSVIELNSDFDGHRRGLLAHELGHALGMGHLENPSSVMSGREIWTSSLTDFDRQAGSILYSRSPGNKAMDTDDLASYRGALRPAGRSGRRHTWICDLRGLD